MVQNANLFVKTNEELRNIIRKHKKDNCPTHSGKDKEQLINIVEKLKLVKPRKKKPAKKLLKKK